MKEEWEREREREGGSLLVLCFWGCCEFATEGGSREDTDIGK